MDRCDGPSIDLVVAVAVAVVGAVVLTASEVKLIECLIVNSSWHQIQVEAIDPSVDGRVIEIVDLSVKPVVSGPSLMLW